MNTLKLVVTLTNAGICMMQKPAFKTADVFFRAALDRKPAFGETWLQIYLLKYREKDYLSSRAFLQRFMSVSTPTAGVLYLASKIEGVLDNDRGATEFEDCLIREFPTLLEARKVLGAS